MEGLIIIDGIMILGGALIWVCDGDMGICGLIVAWRVVCPICCPDICETIGMPLQMIEMKSTSIDFGT